MTCMDISIHDSRLNMTHAGLRTNPYVDAHTLNSTAVLYSSPPRLTLTGVNLQIDNHDQSAGLIRRILIVSVTPGNRSITTLALCRISVILNLFSLILGSILRPKLPVFSSET